MLKIDVNLLLKAIFEKNIKFQYLIVFISAICFGLTDFVGLTLGLLELKPKIHIDSVNQETIILTYDYCLNSTEKWLIDSENNFRFSYVINYHLFCKPMLTAFIGVTLYLGVLIATAIVKTILFYYGRKASLIISLTIYAILLITYAFVPPNLTFLFVFLFVIGFCRVIVQFSMYLTIIEIIPNDSFHYFYSVLLNTYTAFGLIYTTVLYLYQDLLTIKIVIGVLSLAILIPIFLYIVDSPIYFIEKERINDAIHSLEYIARFNDSLPEFKRWKALSMSLLIKEPGYIYSESDKDNTEIRKLDDSKKIHMNLKSKHYTHSDSSASSNQENKDNKGFANILMKKNTRKIFVLMSAIWFFSLGIYYGSLIYIKYIKMNVFLIYGVLYIVEIISNLLSKIVLGNNRFGRRSSYIILFLLLSIFLAFSFLRKSYDETIKVVILILVRFLITIIYNINYFYCNEIYPNSLLSIALSYNSFFGRLGILFNFIVIEYLESNYYKFCFGLSLICFLLSLFLRETLSPIEEEEERSVSKIEQMDVKLSMEESSDSGFF